MNSPVSFTNETPADAASPSFKIGDQHSPLFAVIRDKLRERVLQGEFKPGDRLIEGRLSKEMAVSRIPVREALRALAAEGLVTIEPRRGASVAVLSEEAAYDMVEVRAALEGLNARLAALRRDDSWIEKLQSILDRGIGAVDAHDVDLMISLNARFHETLAVIAGNDVLTDLLRSLRERTALLFAPANVRRAKDNWTEHSQILAAVIAGNPELAALLAAQHVHNAAQAYTDAKPKAENSSKK